jgi:glucose-1-phosphate cytidylyltransferase
MKVIILAGGLGTRISEETNDKPKPMVLIDDKPILWHLMNIFASQGFSDFAIALGYRGDVIRKWIRDLNQIEGKSPQNSISINSLQNNSTQNKSWNVDGIETGLNTQTGGRIAQCMRKYSGQRVIVTYGDGLGNVSIAELLSFHESKGRLATVTAVRPPARFGHLDSNNGIVSHFGEKNQADAGWINGGFFVLEPQVANLVINDTDSFESKVLPELVSDGQLAAFHHGGFWQPMDTLREKNELTKLASQVPPPWLNFNLEQIN